MTLQVSGRVCLHLSYRAHVQVHVCSYLNKNAAEWHLKQNTGTTSLSAGHGSGDVLKASRLSPI